MLFCSPDGHEFGLGGCEECSCYEARGSDARIRWVALAVFGAVSIACPSGGADVDEFREVLVRVPVGDLHVCRDKIKSPGAVKPGPCLPNHRER